MIITSKHEEREEKKKRARLVSQAGGCVAGPAGAAVCQFFVSPFGRSSWVLLLRRRRAPTKRTFLQGCIDLVLLFLAQHLVYCSTLTPDLFFYRTAGTALVIASPSLSLLQQLEAEAFTRSWGRMGRSCYRI